MAMMLGATLVPYALMTVAPRGCAYWSIFGIVFGVPAVFLHEHSLLLLLAWESSFAAYSYCRHAPHASRSLSSYWFFLFVNPVPAFPLRSRQIADPGLNLPGLRRAAEGAALLIVYGALSQFVPQLQASPPKLGPHVVATSLRLGGICAAHFGLASLQIGLCRQVGYAAPERYVQPYRARSPRDFWGRWNTYIGGWIRLYVFRPVVRMLAARWPGRSQAHRSVVSAIALMASFLAVGALHDIYRYAATRRPTADMTLWFAVNAGIIIAWDGLAVSTRNLRWSWAYRFVAPAAMVGVVAALTALLP